MNLAEIESKMSHLRAKSPKSGGPALTLFRHSIDVTKQLAEYYRLYDPEWPVPEEPICLPRVLAYGSLAHDFGKIHIDFQAALDGGPRFRNRHEVLSVAFLGYLNIPAQELPWLEAAVLLHHKNLSRLIGAGQLFFLGSTFGHEASAARRLVTGVNQNEAELLRLLLCHASAIFREAGWPTFPEYSPNAGGFDLLQRIRDALERVRALEMKFHAPQDGFGRFTEDIPWSLRRAGVLVRGFLLNADHLASFQSHSLRVGLERADAVAETLASRLTEGLKSHQSQAAGLGCSGILVAPTGSGKTEAALLWAGKQCETGVTGRTFVLLPYQASMNAMQKRLIADFAPHLMDKPREWDADVALVHGRSMRAAYERLLEQDYSPDKALALARLQSDLGRLNVAPIRVCSPFQIIRLLFAPNGVEGLIASLSSARLIFDEVHAYQPQITALMLAATHLLTEHFGSRVLFVTATLPSHLHEVITKVFGPLALITAAEDVTKRPARHRLNLSAHHVLSAKAVAEIAEVARDKSVLVVVNQVRRAIELHRALKAEVSDAHLLHSRFTHADRFEKEQEIAPVPGRVLVATQAVEVSLDLDYDCCYSELAPLESIIQRFGRCNRRGGRGQPVPVTVYTNFPDRTRPWLPYRQDHLDCTRDVLSDCLSSRGGLLTDDLVENQEMLDASYPPALKRDLSDDTSRKIETLLDLFVKPFAPFGMQDAHLLTQLDRQWNELFDGQEVLPELLRPTAGQEVSWLARARHLVPISGRKYAELKRQDRIEWDDALMCDVVYAPYTKEGLDV